MTPGNNIYALFITFIAFTSFISSIFPIQTLILRLGNLWYDMKNSADRGGCYSPRPKAEVDNTLRDQLFASAFGFGKSLICSPQTNHDILHNLVQ